MSIDFKVRDVMHRIAVKFIHAFLPTAKKAYNLKTVHQPELDVHAIASKASVYNIQTPPKVIEEGMNAGMEIIYYLVADGFKIKTPLFNINVRVPGEYDGSETHLPKGVHARARLQTSPLFRKYLEEHVQVEFDGFDTSDGFIAEVVDEYSGLVDDIITTGYVITIHGYGLKIESDEANKSKVGIFFTETQSNTVYKIEVIAVNEPRTLKFLAQYYMISDKKYKLKIVTQGSVKGGNLLKEVREINFDTELTLKMYP